MLWICLSFTILLLYLACSTFVPLSLTFFIQFNAFVNLMSCSLHKVDWVVVLVTVAWVKPFDSNNLSAKDTKLEVKARLKGRQQKCDIIEAGSMV